MNYLERYFEVAEHIKEHLYFASEVNPTEFHVLSIRNVDFKNKCVNVRTLLGAQKIDGISFYNLLIDYKPIVLHKHDGTSLYHYYVYLNLLRYNTIKELKNKFLRYNTFTEELTNVEV